MSEHQLGNVLKATLTLGPHRGRHLQGTTAATCGTLPLPHGSSDSEGLLGGKSALPARHSKSLDQLKTTGTTAPLVSKPTLIPEPLTSIRRTIPLPSCSTTSSSAPNPSLGISHMSSIARSSSTQIRREKSVDSLKTGSSSVTATLPLIPPMLPLPLRHNLKEKLKNNLRLELKVANGNGVVNSPSTDSGESMAVGYKRLEQSASVPFNLSDATNGNLTPVVSIKHSQSTMSMPSVTVLQMEYHGDESTEALLGTDHFTTAANSSESMPNLVAPLSPPIVPPPVKSDNGNILDPRVPTPAELSILEIGLYSSADPALISVESSLVEPVTVATTVTIKSKSQSPRKSPLCPSLSSPPSSSLSDITSEQSGWVSNSSRRTSGDMSSGQLSPDGSDFGVKVRSDRHPATKQQKIVNGEQLRAKLQKLVEPCEPETSLIDHPYEELRLPPPRQFRDDPPPPEAFRDPPPPPPPRPAPLLSKHKIKASPPLPIDNLLYHVYESVKDVERKNVDSSITILRDKDKEKELLIKENEGTVQPTTAVTKTEPDATKTISSPK